MNTAASATARCAYCEGPLAAMEITGRSPGDSQPPRYCCYGCRVLGEGGHKPAAASEAKVSIWLKTGVGAVIAGQMMALALGMSLAHPEPEARRWLQGLLLAGALMVALLLGPPLLRAFLAELPRLRLEALFLAGILGAFGASVCGTLTGAADVYYDVVAVLLTVYTLGKLLTARSRAQALTEARKLEAQFELCHCLAADGAIVLRAAADIQPGDRVRILAGEPIPVDGRIVRGEALVQETPLSGEPFPVRRRAGDPVFAGSYCEDGELHVAASVPGHQRRLDELLALARAARESPARIQAQADRLVQWFFPVLALAALGTFLWWGWQGDWASGLLNALTVLLVACPCAMGLATPLALWHAMSMLAARGLVLRSPDAIEALATLDYLVFDKTGTLSDEQCAVADFVTVGSLARRRQVCAWVRTVEQNSSHPFAHAFRRFLAAGDSRPRPELRSLQTIPSLGIEACVIEDHGREYQVRIGQRDLMSDLRAEPALLRHLQHGAGDHLIYVSVNGSLQGIAALREQLRPSAKALFADLKSLGVHSAVLTGDDAWRAEQLGLVRALGRMTPKAKAAHLDTLREQGHRVGFVGDGVNDAPAMEAAVVGIALDHGAPLTQATAAGVLYGGDLSQLPRAIDTCRRVRSVLYTNLLFAAAYNLVGIGLAAGGYLHPVGAALLMVLSSLTVSFRAMRASCGDAGCCAWDKQAKPEPPAVSAGSWWPAMTGPKAFALRLQAILQFAVRYAGVLVALQGLYFVYLGGLPLLTGTLVVLGFAGMGLLIDRGNRRWRAGGSAVFAPYWVMMVPMLSVGNWGMLLGWWADAGFAPIVHGACSCQQAASGLTLMGLHCSWMEIGMLLFGLPPMLGDPGLGQAFLRRLMVVMLSAGGMLWGMEHGARLGLLESSMGPHGQLLLGFAGMVSGMTLGMLAGCELGQLLVRGRQWWVAAKVQILPSNS